MTDEERRILVDTSQRKQRALPELVDLYHVTMAMLLPNYRWSPVDFYARTANPVIPGIYRLVIMEVVKIDWSNYDIGIYEGEGDWGYYDGISDWWHAKRGIPHGAEGIRIKNALNAFSKEKTRRNIMSEKIEYEDGCPVCGEEESEQNEIFPCSRCMEPCCESCATHYNTDWIGGEYLCPSCTEMQASKDEEEEADVSE